MVNLLEAIFLGLVQGLTEWLPISSSGHLVIVQQLLGMEVPLSFDVLLHFGTILAVFAFFWKDILKILKFSKITIISIIPNNYPILYLTTHSRIMRLTVLNDNLPGKNI